MEQKNYDRDQISVEARYLGEQIEKVGNRIEKASTNIYIGALIIYMAILGNCVATSLHAEPVKRPSLTQPSFTFDNLEHKITYQFEQ